MIFISTWRSFHQHLLIILGIVINKSQIHNEWGNTCKVLAKSSKSSNLLCHLFTEKLTFKSLPIENCRCYSVLHSNTSHSFNRRPRLLMWWGSRNSQHTTSSVECTLYDEERVDMFLALQFQQIRNTETLLYGSQELDALTNINIFKAVQKYIIASKRLPN